MLSLEVRVLVRGFRWQFGQWGWAVEFEVVVVDVGFGLEGQATTAVTTSLRLTAPPAQLQEGKHRPLCQAMSLSVLAGQLLPLLKVSCS